MHKQYKQVSSEALEEVLTHKIQKWSQSPYSASSGDSKNFLSSVTLHSNIGYNPRSAIFYLTLQLIFTNHSQPFVKYSFGMLRGLYKDYIRSKTPTRPKPPRRSYRNSQISTETTEINEFGEVISQNFMKKGFYKSQSRPESPSDFRKSWESSKSSLKPDNFYKQTFRSLFKIVHKFLNKHFLRFKENTLEKDSKKNAIKNLVSVLINKCFRHSFNQLLKGRSIPEQHHSQNIKVVTKEVILESGNSFNRSESFGRSASFEQKDKELWRKRHPNKRCSPDTRQSLFLSSEPGSPQVVLKNIRTVSAPRRNTEKVLSRFDTFGTNDMIEGESPSLSKESVEIRKIVKNSKGSSGKLRSARPDSSGNEEKKGWEQAGAREKIGRMVGNLEKNRRRMVARGVLKLSQAVEEDKKEKKKTASGLIGDLLGFTLRKHRKNLCKSAFEAIRQHAKEKPEKMQLKKEMKKPPKKPILRAGNQKPASNPSEKGKKFLKFLDFTKTHTFKNKLLAFLAITKNSSTHKKDFKSFSKGLRSVFRVLESKKFSKICRVFHSLKRYSSQRSQYFQKKYIVFAQKLSKLLHFSVKSRTAPVFHTLATAYSRPKAAEKMKSALENMVKRAKCYIKPMVWYKIHSFLKEKQFSSRLKPVKIEFLLRKYYIRRLAFAFVRWENFWQRHKLNIFKRPGSSQGSYTSQFCATTQEKFSFRGDSPLVSGYSTRTAFTSQSPKRILPQPKNIHDYIDDIFEVGRTNTDTSYLPRTSSVGKFRNFQRTK